MNNNKHTSNNNTRARGRVRVRRDRLGRFVSVRRCPVRIVGQVVGYVLGVAVMGAIGLMIGAATAFEPSELMAMFR